MPKLRTFTISGTENQVVPSHARRTKPPAKEISKRKHAALGSGGGRLPPKMREELEREGTDRRVKMPPDQRPARTSTRYGKRKPDAGRYDEAVEQHDRREQRKSNTPETDPGARAVPATRITRNEPKPGRHRGRT
ncbi:MAG: hypothetical protein AUH85_07940 [Chloroflexi bacterium 13_1_40CM_4_68_4]|nr:MAG: hypothetical protein AUH85_07940 [Chloroflexi bacterium 13_1_40CM_4_68_4]